MTFSVLADVRPSGRSWQRANLTDMSVSGFRIAWLPHAGMGQAILVRVPGLEPLRAVIRRSGHSGIGCEFERPLNAYVLAHLARQGAR